MASVDDRLNPGARETALTLLRWYLEMGADEAIGTEPLNRLAPSAGGSAPQSGEEAALSIATIPARRKHRACSWRGRAKVRPRQRLVTAPKA